MKTITFLLSLLPFFLLSNGGCSNANKVLKQELSAEDVATVKAQPSCVKESIADLYENEGDLKNMQLAKAVVNGETVYQVTVGGNTAYFNQNCERVNVDPKQVSANAKYLVGSQAKIGDGPIKINQPNTKPQSGEVKGGDSSIKTGGMPEIIRKKIGYFVKNKSSLSMSQIYKFTSGGKTYFMFDEGMAVDGPAYVLDEKGDTVCVTGGMRRGKPDMPKCPEEDNNSRKMIWEKEAGFIK